MELSFAHLSPSRIKPLIEGKCSKIDCETDSDEASHQFVDRELYEGRELSLDYEMINGILRKAVLMVTNLKHESRIGNIVRHTYQLRLVHTYHVDHP